MKSFFDEGVREELSTRLGRLEPDTPSLWGRMSPHEMVCHLADTFRMSLGEREVSPIRLRLPRSLVKFVALWVPLPWPKGFPAAREVRQGAKGTAPGEWERDLQDLEALMERFDRERSASGAHHPTFGRISSREWGRWGWLHTDHHLRQFGL